jgi:hypothetical protein
MTRDNDKDSRGVKLYDWLKNYPGCEGSPYGEYSESDGKQRGVVFREMNDEKDAQTALTADILRVKAQSNVLALDEATIREVGAILGHYDESVDVIQLKILEYAGKRPQPYFEMMESGDRSIRAIVRKAVSEGIFKTKGEVIMWENTIVGANEDDAISTLIKDPDMLKGLQIKIGLDQTPVAKKSAGNPNFEKTKA